MSDYVRIIYEHTLVPECDYTIAICRRCAGTRCEDEQTNGLILQLPQLRGKFFVNSSDYIIPDNMHHVGVRQPAISYTGNLSACQGRSVREFEEQMSLLRKENFNLKLRIYFLEETFSNSLSSANIIRENVDFKVEIEILRKEVQEKQTLLCDAAQALDLMEIEQKQKNEKSEGTIYTLNEKIEFLKLKLNKLEDVSSENVFKKAERTLFKNIDIKNKVKELEEMVQNYKIKVDDLIIKNNELEEFVNETSDLLHKLETKHRSLLHENTKLMEFISKHINSASFNKDNSQLQEYRINKEFWERNTEIKRLNNTIRKQVHPPTSNPVLKITKFQLYDNHEFIDQQLKYNSYVADIETKTEVCLRKGFAYVFIFLTSRLRELGAFLNLLLKQKNMLGADRRRALCKAIEKSVDLFRCLNCMSFDISGITSNKGRFLQLSYISEYFDINLENIKYIKEYLYDKMQNKLLDNLLSEIRLLKKKLNELKQQDIIKNNYHGLLTVAEAFYRSNTSTETNHDVLTIQIDTEKAFAKILKESYNKNYDLEGCDDSDQTLKLHIFGNNHSERFDNNIQDQSENTKFDTRLNIRAHCSINNCTLSEYKHINEINEFEDVNYKSNSDLYEQVQNNIKKYVCSTEEITEEYDKLGNYLKIADFKYKTISIKLQKVMKETEKSFRKALEKKKHQLGNELKKKIEDDIKNCEGRHLHCMTRYWIPTNLYGDYQRQLVEMEKKLEKAQSIIKVMQKNENDLNAALIENEKKMRNLKKQLDEAALHVSKIILERTKVLNEKLQIEFKLKEAEKKFAELLLSNTETKITELFDNDAARFDQSILNNLSSAFGIESDSNRLFNSETGSSQNQLLHTVEILVTPKNISHLTGKEVIKFRNSTDSNTKISANQFTHDCVEIEQENTALKRKLLRTKQSLEDTWNKLRSANKKKESIERDIRQLILKTQNVLKNVRDNMNVENASIKSKKPCTH